MLGLTQTKNVRGQAGEPLPTVWSTLEATGFTFQRGQLVLVAAGPGVGKSVFALTLALRSQARTMYFSADSDAVTQTARAISILGGYPSEDAKKLAVSGEVPPEIAAMSQTQFSFDAAPSLDTIEQEVEAYYQVNLRDPELIVVDNLTNVLSGFGTNEEDPFGGLEATLDWLNALARRTGACVLALHHVKGEWNDANRVVPLSGIKGQVGRTPPAILTLSRRPKVTELAPSSLVVSVVKNRTGKADPSGGLSADLAFQEDHLRIFDWT